VMNISLVDLRPDASYAPLDRLEIAAISGGYDVNVR